MFIPVNNLKDLLYNKHAIKNLMRLYERYRQLQ